MLALGSSLTEIHDHFLDLASGKTTVTDSKTLAEIKAELEDENIAIEHRFNLHLRAFETQLSSFLDIRKSLCRTYEILKEVENSANNLLSLYKMEVELVLEQFATAFYMQINSEMGNNRENLIEVRGVYCMLTEDLKELRHNIKDLCAKKNSVSSFTRPRMLKARPILEQVGTN